MKYNKEPRRNNKMNFYCSDKEMELLKYLAQSFEISVSKLMRECVGYTLRSETNAHLLFRDFLENKKGSNDE